MVFHANTNARCQEFRNQTAWSLWATIPRQEKSSAPGPHVHWHQGINKDASGACNVIHPHIPLNRGYATTSPTHFRHVGEQLGPTCPPEVQPCAPRPLCKWVQDGEEMTLVFDRVCQTSALFSVLLTSRLSNAQHRLTHSLSNRRYHIPNSRRYHI